MSKSRNNRNRKKFSDIMIRVREIRGICRNFMLGEETLPLIRSFLGNKKGVNDKFTTSWPELIFLRSRIEELSLFLYALPLQARRLVIMREEVLGFSKNALYKRFAYSNDDMNAFTNVSSLLSEEESDAEVGFEQKYLFRRIKPNINYSSEFIAFIAVLSRIPYHWLLQEKPDKYWTIDAYRNFQDIVLNGDQFISFLDGIIFDRYDVRAVKIEHEFYNLYLRVEINYGTVVVELCNVYATTLEYEQFKSIFMNSYFIFGRMQTVVPSQMNPACIWRHPNSLRPLCIPLEFVEVHSLY